MKSCDGGSKLERKTVEKNRRTHMKSLCFKLSSLIPKDHFSKDMMAQQDYFDQAATYIKHMRQRIEKLKKRKEMGKENQGTHKDMAECFKLPMIEVRLLDSVLEVVLINEVKKMFMFHEVISVLEEEGAEIINASFAIVGDKVFHTIHSKAVYTRIGLEASMIFERLKELIH